MFQSKIDTPPSRAVQGAAVRAALVARTPWSAIARRDSLFLAAGLPFGLPCAIVLSSSGGALLLWSFLAVVLFDLLTTAQRSRVRALHGVEIPGRVPPGAGWLVRLRAGLTWRQALHHLVVAPLQALCAGLVLALSGASLVLLGFFGWVWLLPPGNPLRTGPGWAVEGAFATFGGLLLLAAVPWLAALFAAVDLWTVRALLGPNRAEVLERRVEHLARSRVDVVDAADAERRRIERDLHDGAQQRLVSLAMNLGLARRTLKHLPPEALEVIAAAHEEAQAAVKELRDLVRGLHPAVLEDRGLDAALSGIAARSPVPVHLTVDLPGRIAPTVEAVAYFTVSEALANAAKHSRASRVDLALRRSADRLRITITDDGIGGAEAGRGTGLDGLRKRAASVDGSFAITSPRGGPTTITMELPCEL
ncbi:sensor domain-containing protein [Kitasatospora sp. NA04385]|uniref:sensor histidine kinase n=1 Tax=Kitasatospora sp. NA04385 TaxID=2742135 RepID=UPI0015903FE1|nr:sensor histidine kinase [Kitasatospora sp. NA04385]QKW19495.1 sensor domain-containing protein [Kitasatospora sp. NA04385]